jgi:hypothetical protein
MRWALCVAVWLIANVAALYVAAQTKWGPVVVFFSGRHGLHLGDVLAMVLGVAVAMSVTAVAYLTAPDRPPTSVVLAWVLCAIVWEIAIVGALFIAASTDWGPIVFRIWQQKAVHLGDVLVVVVAIGFATAFSVAVWRWTALHSAGPIEASPSTAAPATDARGGVPR